jgi:hypothetical protein
LARSDADPKFRRIQPETGNLGRDRSRLVAVERKNPDAQFEPSRSAGELRQRLQASRGGLVVRP